MKLLTIVLLFTTSLVQAWSEDAWADLVVKRSLTSRSASEDLAVARSILDEARWNLRPSLQVRAGTWKGRLEESLHGLSTGGAVEVRTHVRGGGEAAASLTLRRDPGAGGDPLLPLPRWWDLSDTARWAAGWVQPLLREAFSGDRVDLAADLARSDRDLAERSLSLARRTVRAEAIRLWWQQVERIVVSLETAADTVRTRRLLDASTIRLQTGAGSRIDSLAAALDHLRAVAAHETALEERRRGALLLGALADTVPLEPDEGSLPIWEPMDPVDLRSMLSTALAVDPRLSAARDRVARARRSALAASTGSLPGLELFGALRGPVTGGPDDAVAGARLVVDLPGGGDRAARAAAQARVRSEELRLKEEENTLRTDLEGVLVGLEGARREHASAIVQEDLAKRRLETAELSWRAGSASLLDVQQARAAQGQAVRMRWAAASRGRAFEAALSARAAMEEP